MTSIREQLLTALVATGFHEQPCDDAEQRVGGESCGECAPCLAYAAVKAAREGWNVEHEEGKIIEAGRAVTSAWDAGDLAGAVNALSEAIYLYDVRRESAARKAVGH